MTGQEIKPFRISIPDSKLQRLHQKLLLTDFPIELETDTQSPWSRGPPLQKIKQLTDYWINQYDWRKAETKLNTQLQQFSTTISVDGLGDYNVHFVHMRSRVENAIPLLFLHGWPGNFTEVRKILPLLVGGDGVNEPAFHVVAPSLIDHGFSDGSRVANFFVDQHAEVCNKLMLRLGYEKYVSQGGDTGYVISRILAQQHPRHCVAHHINMVNSAEPKESKNPQLYKRWKDQGAFKGLSETEQKQLARLQHVQQEGMGYFAIQSTRPMTLAYAMTDSPVGLLSWIYDKLVAWTDDYAWTSDEILTWVSIYYFSTAGPASSFNTYHSLQHREPLHAMAQTREWSNVPLGISRFDKEIVNLPKLWSESFGPIVFAAEHEHGGHFAAFEAPEVLVQDLRTMFGRNGGAFGVVTGADGFLRSARGGKL